MSWSVLRQMHRFETQHVRPGCSDDHLADAGQHPRSAGLRTGHRRRLPPVADHRRSGGILSSLRQLRLQQGHDRTGFPGQRNSVRVRRAGLVGARSFGRCQRPDDCGAAARYQRNVRLRQRRPGFNLTTKTNICLLNCTIHLLNTALCHCIILTLISGAI